MSQDAPLTILLLTGLTAWVFRLWLHDFRQARAGAADPHAFPGATPCAAAPIAWAVAGALVLLAVETLGEYALGISAQQKNISALFLLAMVAAAFGEELVFRGFLVVTHRGRAALAAGIVGCSVFFALGHEFLWTWQSVDHGGWFGGSVVFDFSLKAWWSTALVFAGSLWFYTVRFWRPNPARSLWPCIAAHLAKNLGVFIIKLAQGHVTTWW